MTLYHGTIMEYAEKIKREGLKSVPSQVFQIQRTDDDRPPLSLLRDEGYDTDKPHLTPVAVQAAGYALFRTMYERAPIGALLPQGPNEFRKLAGEVKLEASPALVKVELPQNWRRYLRRDIQDKLGIISLKDIPAQYVVDVLPL